MDISPEDYDLTALKEYAFLFQFHVCDFNIEITEIDKDNAETLIEKDFIDLDKKVGE